MIDFAAFATRGVEDVVAAEIADSPAIDTTETRAKVLLTRAANPKAFRNLRTVDDVAAVHALAPAIEDATGLAALITDEGDLTNTIEIAGRADRFDGSFSVTVSAAHSSIGSAAEIEQIAARAIAARYGWHHQEMRRSAIDIRVFIDGTWTLVGVRVFDEPLSRRDYRVVNVRGSLRPTVAAALVRLALPGRTPQRVWDPFCGSGTILCEAALLGHEIWGTDIEPEAVDASRANMMAVRREFWGRIENGDSTAQKTWQKHRTATAIVSNMPWGKQVPIKSKQTLYDTVGSGVIDLVGRGGTGVLLTTDPDRVLRRLKRENGISVDERRISLLGQTPTILTVRPASPV
ncbi:MAG TPA: N-6 DNA methylase [Pseudonocardiaceae bacterium]